MIKYLALTLLLFMPFKSFAYASVIRITNGEWEPYLSEYSYQYGLASHIVKEAFELEGIMVAWGFMPWKRAYDTALIGQEWDAAAVWWPTEAAKNDFLISLPVINTSMTFFHLKSFDFDWKTMSDLQGLTVGITRGYEYGKAFDLARGQGVFKVSEVATDEQNLKMLLHGRIDVFPNDPLVGASQIRNSLSSEGGASISHHPLAFEQSTLHLLVSKRSEYKQLFIDKFNAGFTKLKKSGRLAAMFRDLENGRYDKQPLKWRGGK